LNCLKSRVQNPLVDATSASPMVLLAKSNTSARCGPSLEKVNNPYVTRSDLDMLQSLLAMFGLNAPNSSTPSPPPTYVSPQLLPGSFGGPMWEWLGYSYWGFGIRRGHYSRGSIIHSRGSDAFWSTVRGSPCTETFTAASLVYDRGSTAARGFFPCSQGLGQATLLPNAFNTTTLQDLASSNWNMDTGDFKTRWVLLRYDSTGDLYPVTKPSTIPHAFLTSQYTWNQRLGHLGSEVLRRLVSSDSISCNKEKLPVLCHPY
nr:ribonuclease H-like domain-containing protein [Tanacetum cinerariifolium]